jgi:AcrR family transcriptional regulator
MRHFILDHSEELFIAKGYQKTSMDMIARACGLSKPTLYNYFHGKHEMFTCLYQRLYKSLYNKIKVLLILDKDKRQILRDIIDEYFIWLNTKKDFLQMYFREQHVVIHENIEEHMEWHIKSKEEMVDLLSQALKEIIRPDVNKKFGVEIVASTMFNIFEGLISDLMLRSEEKISEQKKFILEFLRNGVLAGKD